MHDQIGKDVRLFRSPKVLSTTGFVKAYFGNEPMTNEANAIHVIRMEVRALVIGKLKKIWSDPKR